MSPFSFGLFLATMRPMQLKSLCTIVCLLNAASFAAEPLTKPARITLDENGVLVIDGAKVFPITLTVIPGPDSKAPSGKEAYEEFRDAGCMFMRIGGEDFVAKTIEEEKGDEDDEAGMGWRCWN